MAPDTPKLLTALNHPLRRRVLRALQARENASPVELARALDESLSSVSYHVTVLVDCKTLRLVRTQQVRGALEHFYSLAPLSGNAGWVRAALKTSEPDDGGEQQ